MIDINLAMGRFETTYALRKAELAFVFVTGYDDGSIPPDLADVPRLVEPIDPRQLVSGLAQ